MPTQLYLTLLSRAIEKQYDLQQKELMTRKIDGVIKGRKAKWVGSKK